MSNLKLLLFVAIDTFDFLIHGNYVLPVLYSDLVNTETFHL